MLGGGRHAGIAHAVHVGHGQLAHRGGAAVEGAIADDFRQAVVEIHAGREGNIEAAGQQLRGHEPAVPARERQPRIAIEVELMADEAQRRQRREPRAEALHAPAFVIDRHQQPRTAHRMDLCHEPLQLLRVGVVAREQDDAADQRMDQHLAILGRQFLAGDVDHQWSERHCALPGDCPVGVIVAYPRLEVRPARLIHDPAGASTATDSTWVVCGNMSATPAASSSKPCSCTRIPDRAPGSPGGRKHTPRASAAGRASSGSTSRAPTRGGSSSTWL